MTRTSRTVRALGSRTTEAVTRLLQADLVVRLVAPAWQAAYVVIHLWWVIGDPPHFFKDQESYFPGEWVPVALGALALAACVTAAAGAYHQVNDAVRHALAGLNAVAGVALCVYSFLFPVLLVSLLFEGIEAGIVPSLLATGCGVGGGVLCLVVAAFERRLATHPCELCGRVHGRSPESRAMTRPPCPQTVGARV